MTPELKSWIDQASYEDLFRKLKTDPPDSPIHNPMYAASVYFHKALKRKSGELNVSERNEIHARINTEIGLTALVGRGTIRVPSHTSRETQ